MATKRESSGSRKPSPPDPTYDADGKPDPNGDFDADGDLTEDAEAEITARAIAEEEGIDLGDAEALEELVAAGEGQHAAELWESALRDIVERSRIRMEG